MAYLEWQVGARGPRAGAGRCRQCWEAGKLSVWKDYVPPALDFESTLSCRSAGGGAEGVTGGKFSENSEWE